MLRRGHLAPPSALLAPPSALLAPLLAVALALAACNRQPGADTPATTVQAPSSDPWIVQAVTSIGEHATVVAVIHPERWPAVHARLVSLPLPPELAVHLAAAADPSRWLTVLLDVLRPAATPETPRAVVPDLDLTGWDRTRPLVLGFADIPLHAPTGLLAASYAPDHHPGMRHEFVVPATDPAALTASLSRSLAALGPARPEFVTQFPGAHAWALATRDTLAVIPGDRLVRIILDVGAVAPADTATLPDLSPRPAARTTAGVQTLAHDAAAALLIRPHRLPALGTALLAADADTAALANPALAALARRAGLRSQVACELIWGAEPLEIDDYALGLAGDDHGLHLRAVASLTPRGSAALDAGTRFAGMPLALVRPAAVDAWIRLDPTAAAASTGKPVSPLTSEDIMNADFSCGAMVALFSPTAPFAATTRLQAGILGDAPLPANQTAVGQLAVTDVAAHRGGVAMLTDPTVPQDRLELPFRNLGELLGATVKVVAEPEGERQRVRAAYNSAPADVFGGPAAHDGLAHLHADLAALAPLLHELNPAAATSLAAYNRLTGSLRRNDNTVFADLDLTIGDPPIRGLAVATAWDPLPAPAQPRCAQDYARGLTRLLRPIAVTGEHFPDDATVAALARHSLDQALADLAALEPALTCLAADPTVDVQRLRGRAADLLADAFLERYHHADATRVLAVACSAGVAAACTRNQRLATAVVPTLALVDTTCDDPIPGTRTLAVTTSGRTLDGVPLPDLATLRTLVRTDRLTLALDKNLTLADLRELFTMLGELGVPLSFVATTATSPDPQHYPLAAPRLDPSAPLPGDDIPARTITLTGDTVLPPDDGPAVPLSGPLRVAPDDTSRWQTIATHLARTCDGATLVARTSTTTPPKPTTPTITPVKPLSGALDKDVIRRIVRAHINEVRHCYNQALARDPNAKGRVVVQFTIAGDGKVKRAELGESTLPDPTASRCIATAVRRWTFPRPEGGGDVNITYPFVLEPG